MTSARVQALAIVPLRVLVGFGFIAHGYAKFSRGPGNFAKLLPDGPLFGPPGYEINLLYIAALILLAVVGPGPLSLYELRRARAMTPRM